MKPLAHLKDLKYAFVFDVESLGLHGDAFAFAGGVYSREGLPLHEFSYHIDRGTILSGVVGDRDWVDEHVWINNRSILLGSEEELRGAFWREWRDAVVTYEATMFVECGWPVEARFLNARIDDHKDVRNWEGPYPMHEIASLMLAAGMDPMSSYPRFKNELPAHEPLADARQSARLLFEARKHILDATTNRKTSTP